MTCLGEYIDERGWVLILTTPPALNHRVSQNPKVAWPMDSVGGQLNMFNSVLNQKVSQLLLFSQPAHHPLLIKARCEPL